MCSSSFHKGKKEAQWGASGEGMTNVFCKSLAKSLTFITSSLSALIRPMGGVVVSMALTLPARRRVSDADTITR